MKELQIIKTYICKQKRFYSLENMAKLQSQKYRTCIDACNECFEACEQCGTKCLHEEDVKSLVRCIDLCRACSHACATASLVMSAESEYSKQVCKLCSEVCDACAEECEKHAGHMEHCRQCAEICRRCAEECRRVSR
jgi:hypothetical protein